MWFCFDCAEVRRRLAAVALLSDMVGLAPSGPIEVVRPEPISLRPAVVAPSDPCGNSPVSSASFAFVLI
jgi:hypothetical protein